MPDSQTLIPFFGLALLLGYTPGPDNLFVLMQAITHGRRAGLLVLMGLCLGLLVHTATVALGLAAALAASPWAFPLLRACGAAYLLYLAVMAWRAGASHTATEAPVALAPARLIGRGLIMSLTNPKLLLFFLALLPQFINPALGQITLQACVLGATFGLAALIAFGSITWFAGTLGQRLRSSATAQCWLNRSAAVVFALLALRLLLPLG